MSGLRGDLGEGQPMSEWDDFRDMGVSTPTIPSAGEERLRRHVDATNLQRFYNLTTWLLSEAPTGRLDEGATVGYHHALRAVTGLRDELRRDKMVEHDEGFWHLGRKHCGYSLNCVPISIR